MDALAFSLVVRRTEKAVAASGDDRDLCIAGEFERTLAELDEDLEGEPDPCGRTCCCVQRTLEATFLTTLCIMRAEGSSLVQGSLGVRGEDAGGPAPYTALQWPSELGAQW